MMDIYIPIHGKEILTTDVPSDLESSQSRTQHFGASLGCNLNNDCGGLGSTTFSPSVFRGYRHHDSHLLDTYGSAGDVKARERSSKDAATSRLRCRLRWLDTSSLNL